MVVIHTLTVHFFLNIVAPACALFQCSRSCGSGIQKRELHCGERDSQGGYVPSTARRGIPHTLGALHRHLGPHCVICLPASDSQYRTAKTLWEKSFRSDNVSSPTQVRGVSRTEVQEYGQATGGSPAGLQPRPMPRASPHDPW